LSRPWTFTINTWRGSAKTGTPGERRLNYES
jgi:hypothetical protein